MWCIEVGQNGDKIIKYKINDGREFLVFYRSDIGGGSYIIACLTHNVFCFIDNSSAISVGREFLMKNLDKRVE